jgi:chloramphenicol 3-O phosphotransferase
VEKGHIILLNGTSSSGKSTLSWELQAQSAEEYYWLSNDAFTDMPHNAYYDRDRMKTYATAISMLFKTAMLFLSNGINVIIDHVMLDDESGKMQELLDCVETLRDAHVLFVFVSCPLDELNRRELARQDTPSALQKVNMRSCSRKTSTISSLTPAQIQARNARDRFFGNSNP